jgi:hypothetical protein
MSTFHHARLLPLAGLALAHACGDPGSVAGPGLEAPASDGDADPTEDVPLTFGSVEVSYEEMKTDDDCIELEIHLPTAYVPETKTTVEFDASVLTMATLPGPANLLADLICADDRAVELGWSLESAGEQ